jgi:hypothetical protein
MLKVGEVYPAVLHLLATFSARIDRGEGVADLFHEDAVFVTPKGAVRTCGAIATLFETRAAQQAAGGRLDRHIFTNLIVEERSDGSFDVRSILLALAMEPGAAQGSMLVGDQSDIVKAGQDGALKFSQRELVPALHFALSPISHGA